MIKEYLKVTYLTVLIFWPAIMTLISAVAGVMFHLGFQRIGIVMVALFSILGIAAWQFENDM